MARAGDCVEEKLDLDQACVTIKNHLVVSDLWLYSVSTDCDQCPYEKITKLPTAENLNLKIDSATPQIWRVIETSINEEYIPSSNNDGLYCEFSPDVGQYGIYEFEINSNNTCNLITIKVPQSEYITLAIAFGLIILLLSSLSILKLVKNVVNKPQTVGEDEEAQVKSSDTKRRVRSIDTVRGMCILWMIFVNSGRGGYQRIDHIAWDGLYLGDFLCPCFLWIMGLCIPLSISSQLSRGTSTRSAICWGIVKRSIYLFLIGVCLNTCEEIVYFEKLRVFGVFQRFAVGYLVPGICYAALIPSRTEKSKRKLLSDVTILLPQWTIELFILLCHTIIIFFLPVPGCPRGYFGPGGLHADGKYWNCTGGATGYIDKVVLGMDHLYQFPSSLNTYKTGPFEPEGILGSMTTIFQVFLGIQAGQTLRDYKEHKSRLLRWLVWAVVFGIIGSILHFTIIPINKNLWSLSFVLVTTSSFLILAILCYLLVDVYQIWEGGPFRIPGMNALIMYMGHRIFHSNLPFHWKYGEMNTHGWCLAETLTAVGAWCVVAYTLHHKRKYFTL